MTKAEQALENYKNTKGYKNMQFKRECEKFLSEQAPYMCLHGLSASAEEQTATFCFCPIDKNTYVIDDKHHYVGWIVIRIFRCGDSFRVYEITNYYDAQYSLGERLHEIYFSGYGNFKERVVQI